MSRCLAAAAIACAAFAFLLCHQQALSPAYVDTLPVVHPSQAALPVGGGLGRALIGELGASCLPDTGCTSGGYFHVTVEAEAGRMAFVFAPADQRGASDNGEIYVFEKSSFDGKSCWRCTVRLCGNSVTLEPGPAGRPNLITRWHLGHRQGILERHVYDCKRGRYASASFIQYDE